MIAATSTPAALAARTASTTIPIVFTTAGDPVRLGLVISLSRPGGNITGATRLNMEVTPKRLELLRELVPTATDFAYLVNPSNPLFAQNGAPNLRATAEALGLTLHTLNASSDRELELALASAARSRFRCHPLVEGSAPPTDGKVVVLRCPRLDRLHVQRPERALRFIAPLGLCCPIGGVEKIAIRQRSHALCNELGLFWIGLVLAIPLLPTFLLPWIGMEPDFIAGIVRHFVRSAIKDHGYQDQRQECPEVHFRAFSIPR